MPVYLRRGFNLIDKSVQITKKNKGAMGATIYALKDLRFIFHIHKKIIATTYVACFKSLSLF